jgi:putative alpha-1,2-mannosidase
LWFRLGADLAGFLGAAGCHQEFQKRLKNLVEKTRAGKQFGGLCRKLEMP